ncbi:hypothetical protein ZIOFF_035414 [Zingiber officinale]|uniref:dUTP diphosphatase n=1 Tax=Zingiber officinale TaxID=94328 RepID=A0A8J5L0Q4_ZINOF|nr:hypothetical protein ZIOFF_035414 [Zingiber officinale]
MDLSFKGTKEFIAVYIDDILVFSLDERTHEQHLRQMLHICRLNGLILSPTKMKIAVKEVEFLGAIIGNCKIKLQPHVISKIADFNDNDLKTTKGMRSWLGLLNYARNYIPNLGKLLSPLYAKTSPNGEKRLNQLTREAISSTDPIEPPSIGFAKPSDYQGVTPGIATLIKQNNTQIQLLVQISEALKEIQIEICKQKSPAIPSYLISKLQNLSLGPLKLKEKPGKLRANIPMQPAEVNSQTMVDSRISLSFSNYTAAQPSENPQYNSKDEEVFETLAVLIETKLGVLIYSDDEYENSKEKRKKEKRKEKYKTGRWDSLGQPSGKFDYYVNYDIPQIPSDLQLPPPSWGDEEENAPDKPNEREGLDHEVALEERYSSSYEPHILVHRISSQAVIPERQTSGSAGLDIAASHAAVIEPYGRDLIHTGLQIEVPYEYYGQLASRSELAWQSGIEVGAGVIDSDYRGEVQVLLFNRTNLPVYISPQQRIAQLILKKIAYPEVYEVPHLSYTERGEKGFGSTDIQPNEASTSTIQQNKASNSPKYFTTEDIFTLLMPREKLAVFVQETSLQNSYEQDHAANTSPGASVPRSMEPTLNHEEDDDSNLDYI